jgi:hypothetical protein
MRKATHELDRGRELRTAWSGTRDVPFARDPALNAEVGDFGHSQSESRLFETPHMTESPDRCCNRFDPLFSCIDECWK